MNTQSWMKTDCDISTEQIDLMECVLVDDGNSSGGGGYIPPDDPDPTVDDCDCSVCPVCGGCLPIFEGDPVTLDPDCGDCICPLGGGGGSLPVVDASGLEQNEKADCVFKKLIKTGTNQYNALVNNFLVQFSDDAASYTEIHFELEDLGIGVGKPYGQIVGDGYVFTVDLNSNYIDNRSSIEIAKTLIHEILHAVISRKMELSPYEFKQHFRDYLRTNNGVLTSDVNDHDLMRDHYVQPMVNFLKDFDSLNGFNEDDYYYEGLAITGVIPQDEYTSSEIAQMTAAMDIFQNRGLECE